MDLVVLVLAASATALATGLGALPVFFMGSKAELLRPILLGTAIGAMTVASLLGLLKPALEEGGTVEIVLGLLAGVVLVVGAHRLLARRDVHVGDLRGSGVRLSVLVFGVLFVHSLPEGLAIGTAYASDLAGLSLFVILAIGLQNIPEGTSVAIPMAEAGFSRAESVLGSRADECPAACGRRARVPRRRARARAAARLVRVRSRRDARASRLRARAAGIRAEPLAARGPG